MLDEMELNYCEELFTRDEAAALFETYVKEIRNTISSTPTAIPTTLAKQLAHGALMCTIVHLPVSLSLVLIRKSRWNGRTQ